jgi:hypothetical protein
VVEATTTGVRTGEDGRGLFLLGGGADDVAVAVALDDGGLLLVVVVAVFLPLPLGRWRGERVEGGLVNPVRGAGVGSAGRGEGASAALLRSLELV